MYTYLTDLKTLGLLYVIIFHGNKRYDSQWKYICEVLAKGKSLTGELAEFAKERFLTDVWHLSYTAVTNMLVLTSCFPGKMKTPLSACVACMPLLNKIPRTRQEEYRICQSIENTKTRADHSNLNTDSSWNITLDNHT